MFYTNYPVFIIIIEIFKAISEYLNFQIGFNGVILISNFVFIFISGVNIKRIKTIKFPFFVLIIFCTYMFFRLEFDEGNFFNLISRFGNFFMGLFFVIYGFVKFSNYNDLFYLNRSIILSAVLFASFSLFSIFFQFGNLLYSGGLLRGFVHYQWYYLALFIGVFPIISQINSIDSSSFISQKVLKIVYLVILLLAIVSLMRTVWTISIIHLIMFYLFAKKNYQNKKLYRTLIFILFFGVYFVFATDYYLARESRLSSSYEYEKEGRIVELELVENLVLSNESKLWIGTGNAFDEIGKYGFTAYERPLHGTYTKLLFGGGVTAIFLDILFILSLVYLLIKSYFKVKQRSLFLNNVFVIAFTSIITYSIAIFSGSAGIGAGVGYVTVNFLLVGIYSRIIFEKEK